MRAAIYTLGCKVNQYESQAMEKMLAERGHEIVSFDSDADVYIINTCSVTAESDRKSRQIIRRARKLNPCALVAVCGCFSQTHREQACVLGADIVFGTNDKERFIESLMSAGEMPECNVDNALSRRTFEQLPAGGLEGRTRAMLKVQDGCVNFCTYCIIPYARGPVRSLPFERALQQAEKLCQEGYKEIVITGIEISSYGVDLKDGNDIVSLTKALCAAVPDVRIRLGSLEPRTVTERFCSELKQMHNLCPHFHLSMQSGCDSVLRRMGRKYDTARYYESVQLLRKYFPECSVTTDMIVGFPGETQEEFDMSLEFIRRCAFSSMHIFPYSKREGTKAADMSGQIEKSIKASRARAAAAVAEETKREYLKMCVGSMQEVLFESYEDGVAVGHAPNYTQVRVESSENLHGEIRTVRITGNGSDWLTGDIV